MRVNRLHFSRKAAIAVGLVVLALLAVSAYFYLQPNQQGKTTELQPGTREQQEAKLDATVDKAYLNNDYEAAAKAVEDEMKAKGESSELQLKLAVVYANDKDYQQSLALFKAVEAKGGLNASYTGLAGDIASKAGEYQTAVDFYELAKKRVAEEGSPVAPSEINRYNTKIQAMKAKI